MLNYISFLEAIKKGDIDECYSEEQIQEFIMDEGHEVFTHAVGFDDLEILIYLEYKVPGKFYEMISEQDYDAFWEAAKNGCLKVLRFLFEKLPHKLDEMIFAKYYDAFLEVVKNGYLEVLKYLVEKAPHKLDEVISANDYEAFRLAASKGHLKILQYLEEKLPHKLDEMISANDYEAFWRAASKGHLKILQYLKEKAPHKLDEMISANDYEAFWRAAENGHLDVLQYLEEKAPHKLDEMISADEYVSFRVAASKGHLKILQYLEEKAPNKLNDMISAADYGAFCLAAEYCNLNVLLYLESKAPHKMTEMLSVYNYESFGFIYYRIDNKKYFYHILDFPQIFDHAEEHYEDYHERLQSYIDLKIKQLTARNLVILDSEKNHYFIVLRNLIRRNESNLLANIKVLINHPQISPLLARNNNELFRLAQSINNLEACQELMSNQAVNVLARQNNFYANQSIIDFVNDRESSMRALTSEEVNLVKEIRGYYSKKLEEKGGVEKVLDELKVDLSKQSNFDAKLEDRYKNPFDTAWRYLSTPNPLLHKHAGYTKNGGANISDNDKELIAVFYLAAIDKEQPATVGTIEDRFELFAQGLADLGRAHNQDEGQDRFTEGDKPSCLSGVRKRVFLILQNHPMFKIINPEIVTQALVQFAYKHFKAILDQFEDDSLVLLDGFYKKDVDLNEEINKIRHVFDLKSEEVHQALEAELGHQYNEFKEVVIDKILAKTPHIEGILGNQSNFFVLFNDKVHNVSENMSISYKP